MRFYYLPSTRIGGCPRPGLLHVAPCAARFCLSSSSAHWSKNHDLLASVPVSLAQCLTHGGPSPNSHGIREWRSPHPWKRPLCLHRANLPLFSGSKLRCCFSQGTCSHLRGWTTPLPPCAHYTLGVPPSIFQSKERKTSQQVFPRFPLAPKQGKDREQNCSAAHRLVWKLGGINFLGTSGFSWITPIGSCLTSAGFPGLARPAHLNSNEQRSL